jgi:hypothetical protein
MKDKIKHKGIASLVVVTFIIMVTVNGLANALPINGKGTGEISDFYSNLFAPVGFTFAIWGVIYLLLFAHIGYQFVKSDSLYNQKQFRLLAYLFSFSSIVNTIWIFAWHYEVIGLSLVLMLLILASLIGINMILKSSEFEQKDSFYMYVPFAVYFGWITIATIANVTTLLVSLGWNGFGLSDAFWTSLMVLVGASVGVMTTLYLKRLSYGLVFVWAYYGIAYKHWSSMFFDKAYPGVIVAVGVSLALILATLIIVYIKSRKKVVTHG